MFSKKILHLFFRQSLNKSWETYFQKIKKHWLDTLYKPGLYRILNSTRPFSRTKYCALTRYKFSLIIQNINLTRFYKALIHFFSRIFLSRMYYEIPDIFYFLLPLPPFFRAYPLNRIIFLYPHTYFILIFRKCV